MKNNGTRFILSGSICLLLSSYLSVLQAQLRHYGSIQSFAQQISILNPELFIFSLGTNEAFRGTLSEKAFFKEIDAIVAPIREANPNALVLSTTPPDCLVIGADKSKKSNPIIPIVRKVLIQYTEAKGCTYWDLYPVLDGEGSAIKLYEVGHLAKDGVHFLREGYNLLGNLFFDALISNYSNYVQYRLR